MATIYDGHANVMTPMQIRKNKDSSKKFDYVKLALDKLIAG